MPMLIGLSMSSQVVPAGFRRGMGRLRPAAVVLVAALLIYRGASVYVTYQGDAPRGDLTANPDVQLLTGAESHRFEASLPFPLPAPVRPRGVRLGDVIHRITGRLGVAHCDSCQRRKRALNRIVVWGWWRRASRA